MMDWNVMAITLGPAEGVIIGGLLTLLTTVLTTILTTSHQGRSAKAEREHSKAEFQRKVLMATQVVLSELMNAAWNYLRALAAVPVQVPEVPGEVFDRYARMTKLGRRLGMIRERIKDERARVAIKELSSRLWVQANRRITYEDLPEVLRELDAKCTEASERLGEVLRDLL